MMMELHVTSLALDCICGHAIRGTVVAAYTSKCGRGSLFVSKWRFRDLVGLCFALRGGEVEVEVEVELIPTARH
jgi:hypothetical protein